MKNDTAKVIVPPNLDNPPEPHEIEIAWILAERYNCTVRFLKPVIGYKIKTPDIEMQGIMWEMKSPIGKSKTTIDAIMRKASKQSKYIVFDGRRTVLPDAEIEKAIQFEMKKRREIKKVIIITKEKNIVEIA